MSVSSLKRKLSNSSFDQEVSTQEKKFKVYDYTLHELPDTKSWIKTFTKIPIDIQADEKILQSLVDLKPQERGKAVMWGKEVDIPRWQKLYGPDYRYGGVVNKGNNDIDHPYIQKLLKWVQDHSGLPYTQIIVNWYMTGKEYMGAHSDNESQLVPGTPIYSFSFGATRDFVVKGKKSNYKQTISLSHNSLLIMGGEMQKHYKHEVPKRLKVTKPRINITFRVFK